MDFSAFHFIRSQWLWGLIPLAILLLAFILQRKKTSSWRNVCEPHLLKHLLQNFNSKQRYGYLIALALSWLIAIIALAGPTWKRLPQPIFQKQAARIIALDLSSTMLTGDLAPNRLVRARYKLNDLLSKTTEGQTGLIVFAGEAYVASPLTHDTRTLTNMVEKLSPTIMPIQGHNIASALTLASQLLQQSHIAQGDIILLTNSSPTQDAFHTAEKLAQQGYKTSVLGIGTAKGAPIKTDTGGYLKDRQGAIIIGQLDKEGLKTLAQKGQGQYIDFRQSDSDIEQLQKISQSIGETKSDLTTQKWQDQGHWFVLLILPFAAMAFRRGWLGEIVR